MVNDTIADLLTRIRNASRAGHKSVRVPKTIVSQRVLDVLRDEGFIEAYAEKFDATDANVHQGELEIVLKYGSGQPAIELAKRVSKPGRRIYAGYENLPQALHGLGLTIVSTSQGVMSDREARRRKIGGEVVATIG